MPPRIVRGVGKNEAVQGEDFNFTCLADGYPTPTFEFHKVFEFVLIVTSMLVLVTVCTLVIIIIQLIVATCNI